MKPTTLTDEELAAQIAKLDPFSNPTEIPEDDSEIDVDALELSDPSAQGV